MMDHQVLGDVIANDKASLPVRRIGMADLRDSLEKGLADFWAMPSHVLFIGIFYPVIGIFLAQFTFGNELLPLLFPLSAGFALIGPFAAIGLYELSRRREQGLEASWGHAFDVLQSPSLGAVAALGLVLTVIFFAWLGTALAIYRLAFGGSAPTSIAEFAVQVFTTWSGWMLILVGNGVGFLFAAVVLAISVVSFPLILDRNVSAVTAVRTSVRAVRVNPKAMAIWGLIVAGALLIGSLPLFVGLAVVMPVLGHSTWHLYRRVVGYDGPSPTGTEAPSSA